MKTYWKIPILLILTLLSGCTIVHNHYHYYQDDIRQSSTSTPCRAHSDQQLHFCKSKKMHGCGNHGMDHHVNRHNDDHDKYHGTDNHGGKHGMMHEKMKQMHHGPKDFGMPPCGAGCPCGCQQGEECDCPAAGENLEGLFGE